ncbi:DUF423 domain-containing protein [Terrilactibacillus sp. S3-3]|nr:DUF423 domain-containing protein [Terrilactibacillus sp. S3-3]
MKIFIVIGAALSFLSVAFGAFGAHVLKDKISAHYMDIFFTGVEYQMMHGLGLILVGILAVSVLNGSLLLNWSGWLMLIGVVLFSGSLLLSITGIGILGAITPFGGVAFLISWLLVVIAFIKG